MQYKITRREYLKSTIAAALLPATWQTARGASEKKSIMRFGVVTDSHYADAPDKGARCYRQSLGKMQACVDQMNKEKVDFLIELGDFKDQGSPASEKNTLNFLDAIESVYAKFNGPRYHVLGNHDMDSISKSQFLNRVENTGISKESSFYSFDMKSIHCVVLDANFKSDGKAYNHGNFHWKDANIPPAEVEWLKKDLASTELPVICFSHQELNGGGSPINNAEDVRKILAEKGSTLAVLQGHHHEGAYVLSDNTHFYTLKCMVEGTKVEESAFAIVDVYKDGSLAVTGYHRATSKELKRG